MIFSESDTSVSLTIRIEDFHHNGLYDDRFNRVFAVNPGAYKIVIPLDDVKNAPAFRKMDMSAISAFYLFAFKTKVNFAIYIDDIRSE